MSTVNKLTYLNGTKQAIKNAINEDFEVIDDNTTFREYADEISSNNAKYKGLIPQNTVSGTNSADILNSAGLDKALVTQYGNTYQETTTGKNLVNYNDNINNSVPNLTITTDSDGYIIVNGTKNVGYPAIVNQVEITDILEDGETYTIWQEDITPSGTSGFSKCENRIRALNTQGQYSNLRTLGNHTNKLSINKTTFLKYYVDVVLPNNAETYNNYKNRFMLLKGSYNDSDLIEYEKYTNGASPNLDYPQEIVNISGKSTLKDVGKNLFNFETYTNTNDLTSTISGTNVKITGTATLTYQFLTNRLKNPYQAGTYTFSITQTLPRNLIFRTFDVNGNTLNSYTITAGQTSVSFTLNGNEDKYSLLFGSAVGQTYDIDINLQLEKGNQATTYQPYQEQSYTINLGSIELCKIGNYKDRIYYSSGEWYLEKNIGKIVLDGTENWVLPQTQTNTLRFNCEQVLVNGLDRSIMKIISDKFVNGTSTSDNGDYEHIRSAVIGYPNMISICINKTRLSNQNINSFKTWLSNNNVTVYYVLGTPTTEEITESNYPTLYNQLNNIKLFEGVNHITITNESGLDVEFDIEYYKDWKLD